MARHPPVLVKAVDRAVRVRKMAEYLAESRLPGLDWGAAQQ